MTRGMLLGVLAAAAVAYPTESRAGGVSIGIVLTGHNHYRHEAYRVGADRGSDDGWRRGYDDGRRARRFNYVDEACYRRGTDGYRPSFGPRSAYVAGYQNGFEEAYRRGFQAGRRRDRHDGWRSHDDDWRYRNDGWNDDRR